MLKPVDLWFVLGALPFETPADLLRLFPAIPPWCPHPPNGGKLTLFISPATPPNRPTSSGPPPRLPQTGGCSSLYHPIPATLAVPRGCTSSGAAVGVGAQTALGAKLEGGSRGWRLRPALGGGARGRCAGRNLRPTLGGGTRGQASGWRARAELGDGAWRCCARRRSWAMRYGGALSGSCWKQRSRRVPQPARAPRIWGWAAGAAGLGLRACPREPLKKSPSKVLFMVTLKNIEVIFSLPLCHEP
jgi:hypothetical protein